MRVLVTGCESRMTLDDAIDHADEVVGECLHTNFKCAQDHADLAAWLIELKHRREEESAAEKEAHDLAVAAQALLDSLGEYVRQSMHMNPEWRTGVRAIENALWARRRRIGKIDSSES